jgi:hypothetical protein
MVTLMLAMAVAPASASIAAGQDISITMPMGGHHAIMMGGDHSMMMPMG